MQSIFNLKTDKSQLSAANAGVGNLYYDQVLPLRNVVDNSVTQKRFPGGNIIFRFTPPAGYWWIPQMSYFKINGVITDQTGNRLDLDDEIAPNMGAAACLFSKMQYRLNDMDISEISENCAQVDALKTRMRRERSWMRTIGNDLNYWKSGLYDRLATVRPDGGGLDSSNVQWSIAKADPYYVIASEPYPPTVVLPATSLITGVAAGDNDTSYTFTGSSVDWNNDPKFADLFSVGQRIIVFPVADGGVPVNVQVVTRTNSTANDARGTLVVNFGRTNTRNANNTFIQPVARANLLANNTFFSPAVLPVSSSSYPAKSKTPGLFNIIWSPPLSIFDISHAIPGGSKNEFVFTPQPDNIYPLAFVESATNKTTTANFNVLIKGFEFFVARVQGPTVVNQEFYLDLTEVRCQVSPVESNSRTQTTFDVVPSTKAISIAFQDNAAGTVTTSSATKFIMPNNAEQTLSQFYIRYGGFQKPQPEYSTALQLPDVGAATTSTVYDMTELYARNAIYDGGIELANRETFKEYLQRGLYLHFPWPLTGYSRDTRAYVSTAFVDDAAASHNVLLFTHYSKVVIVTIQNGLITQVLSHTV